MTPATPRDDGGERTADDGRPGGADNLFPDDSPWYTGKRMGVGIDAAGRPPRPARKAAADRVTLDRLTAAAKGRGMVSEMADMAEVAVLVCGLHDRAELAEAALAQAQHANDAERGEWSEYYALLTGDRGAWSPDDMRRAVKAQTDALAQARALLAEVAGKYHEVADGHDSENFRGCTHAECVELRAQLAALSDGAR